MKLDEALNVVGNALPSSPSEPVQEAVRELSSGVQELEVLRSVLAMRDRVIREAVGLDEKAPILASYLAVAKGFGGENVLERELDSRYLDSLADWIEKSFMENGGEE